MIVSVSCCGVMALLLNLLKRAVEVPPFVGFSVARLGPFSRNQAWQGASSVVRFSQGCGADIGPVSVSLLSHTGLPACLPSLAERREIAAGLHRWFVCVLCGTSAGVS